MMVGIRGTFAANRCFLGGSSTNWDSRAQFDDRLAVPCDGDLLAVQGFIDQL